MTTALEERPLADRLRYIAEHGNERQRAQARELLREHGLIDDPIADRRDAIRDAGPFALAPILVDDASAASPLHEHLNAWHLAETRRPPGSREAVAAPRGHGKTTAGVELPAIWHAANCTRRFQVIVSDTADQARERIQAIKAAVEENEQLRELYPRLRPAFDYGVPGTWRESDLVFACGCRIVGVGAGKSVRGLKHRDRRPDLLYLDDLEDEDSVSTPYQIEKRHRWLMRVALALGDQRRGMSVLWVGTILSRDALLNLATGAALDTGQSRPEWAKAWHPRVFRAEVDGTPRVSTTATILDPDTGEEYTWTADVGEPMWSALTREDLVRIRANVGAEAYAAEYMSDPVAAGDGMIDRPRVATVLNPHAPPRQRVIRLESGEVVPVAAMTVAAALDPQTGKPGESADPDLAAIAVVGQYGAFTVLLDSWVGRDRDGQASRVVELGVKWGAYAVAVEATQAQVLIADQAARASALPVVPVKPVEGKEVRALGVATRASTGRLYAIPDSGDNAATVDHLVKFPHGRYDDPVDAVVMATKLATRGAYSSGSGGGGGAGPRLAGSAGQ